MTKAIPNISQYFFLVNVIDPTKTITLRQRFVRDMNSRFFRLMADVKEAIVDLDVFGLKKEAVKVNASGLSTGAFDFPTNSRKIDAFTEWLNRKAQEYILAQGTSGMRLSGQIGTGLTDIEAARKVWINTYLDSAYQQGIRRARQELRKAGVEIDEGQMGGDPIKVAFNGPIHADRVGMIYTRAYTSLKGITAEMESAVSDVLAMGLAEGRGPKQIARILDKTITGRGEDLGIVDKLGRRIDSRRRAEVLARTEVIRSHHSANMAEYRAAGAMGISVLAEHLTAGDDRVCPKCAPLNGKKYTLEEAEYIIPVHPQCRCVAIPYIEDTPEVVQKPELPKSDSFVPAITRKQAQDYAKSMKFAKHVDYTGLPVEVCNSINESFYENIRMFPHLAGKMSFLGINSAAITRYKTLRMKDLMKIGLEETSAEEQVKSVIDRSLKMKSNTWAYCIPKDLHWNKYKVNGITVNQESFIFPETLKKKASDTVKSKWHAEFCDSIKSMIDHEIGHYLDMSLGRGSAHNFLKGEFEKRTLAQMKDDLSEYGYKNIKEMVAEGWAEYVNSPNPRPLAKKIGDYITKFRKSVAKPKAWRERS